MNIKNILGGLVLVGVVGVGIYYMAKDEGQLSNTNMNGQAQVNTSGSPEIGRKVVIETNKGTLTIGLYEKDAPKTTKNFIDLASKGFYNTLTFHRVIPGFMIQGGDPKGTGTGGPGYQFEDELDPATPSAQEGYKKGVVAMANAGPNTNGSQFFIMVADYPLPHNYTIFGRVLEGQEVADTISQVSTNSSDKPLEPVIIQTVTLN